MEPPRPEVRGGFTTRAVHAAVVPDLQQRPVAPAIHPASTFAVERSADLADLLTDRLDGYVYGRYDNPTNSALHAQIAALHETEAAWSFGSGIAAIHAAVESVRGEGRVLTSTRVYGGTYATFRLLRERAGWQVDTADLSDPAALDSALTDAHTVVHVETIANPTADVADLEGLARRCHERGVTLVVDNTFASPWLCRPSTLAPPGTVVTVESATKFLSGHSDVVAGVLAGTSEQVRRARRLTIELGASLGPFEAWLVSRGIQTLALRMERCCATAALVAADLAGHPRVREVRYPGLASHPHHRRARRQFGDRGYGAVFTFDLADRASAERFADDCEVFTRAGSLGGSHSLVIHPASTTHRQLSDGDLERAGIHPGTVRLSVGLEDPADLRADILRALTQSEAA